MLVQITPLPSPGRFPKLLKVPVLIYTYLPNHVDIVTLKPLTNCCEHGQPNVCANAQNVNGVPRR